MKGSRYWIVWTILIGMLVVLPACSDDGDEPDLDREPPEQSEPVAMSEDEPVEPPEVMDDERSVSDRMTDMQVAARVKQELTADGSLRTFDFEPEVTDGELVLWGDVLSRNQYDRAESIAADVDGVSQVHNALTIEGQSVASTDTGDGDDESPSAPASAEFHTIQSGESLWIIARSYGTSVERIQQLNDISGTNVQPGDRIRVR